MSNNFFDFEISTYGKTHGFVDLAAVAAKFNHTPSLENPYFGYDYEVVNGCQCYYCDNEGNEYPIGIINSITTDLMQLIYELEKIKEKSINLLQEIKRMSFTRPIFDKFDSFRALIDNVTDELEQEIPVVKYVEREYSRYEMIDKNGYEILAKYTDEFVYYIPELDKYIWLIPYSYHNVSWTEILTTTPIPKS